MDKSDPAETRTPTEAEFQAAFTDYAGHNYALAPGHPYWTDATDGTFLGADIAKISQLTAIAQSGDDSGNQSGGSTPYGGTPFALPGRLEAENFDEGSEGVAYHDVTPTNEGGQYRATDVDIEDTSDTGGGHDVGWAVAGEWLNYTVNVTSAGTYSVDFRVASNGQGGTFHLEVNGVDMTGPMTIPDTGGWQSWTTVTKTGVSLSSGVQVWRLVLDTVGAGGATGNFNFIEVNQSGGSTPYGGTPFALPGRLEAENFDEGGEGVAYHDQTPSNEGGQYRATDVDIEDTSDTGGGHDVGWAVAGEWLNYTVNVTSAGTYSVDFRVASNGQGGTFHLEVNGVDMTGPMTIPDTGGWQSWTTVTKTGVSLSSGLQVWRLVLDTVGASGATGNFNFIEVR